MTTPKSVLYGTCPHCLTEESIGRGGVLRPHDKWVARYDRFVRCLGSRGKPMTLAMARTRKCP